MGRQPCCDKVGLKKGPWTAEEDRKLVDFIINNGHCCWRTVPKLAGLLRCGKSCRLRWTNYLRPDLKRGVLSEAEEKLIIELHSHLGNRWAKIAAHLPGRTDNEIKNYWNTHIKKKLKRMGIDPLTHQPIAESPSRAEQPALSEPLIVNAEAEQQAAARYDDTKPRLAVVAIPTMSMGEPKLRDSESVRGYEPPNVCKGPAVKTEILTMGGNMKEEVSDGTVSSGSNQSEVTYNILEDDKSIDSLTNRADIIPSRFGFGCSSMFGDHDVKFSVPVSSCKIEEKEPFGAQYNEKLEACQSWEPVGCNNAMLFDQQENGPLMLQGDDNLWGFADLVGCFNKGISSNSDGGMQSCNVGIESGGEFKWTNGHEPNNTDMLVTGSTLPAPGGESSGQLWLQAAVDPFLAWEGGSAVNSSQAFYPHELRRLAATLDSI